MRRASLALALLALACAGLALLALAPVLAPVLAGAALWFLLSRRMLAPDPAARCSSCARYVGGRCAWALRGRLPLEPACAHYRRAR